MTLLEQAGEALAVRPLLWDQLDSHIQVIIRARLEGQLYGVIAEVMGAGQGWDASLVQQYELAGCHMVLKKQELAIKLDRLGYGRRWSRR